MRSIAIIPARGGSRRIPRKNIREFMGKPMLAYAIEAALESGLFDEVMVSTDDREIAETAKRFNASVPFMRSGEASSDTAVIATVFQEVLANYALAGENFDIAACIYPCVPLLTGKLLRAAHTAFCDSKASALLPVVRYGHPIQRALGINAAGYLEYREPENALVRTQDLQPMFHDSGMFFFVRVDAFLRHKRIVMPDMMPFEVSENIAQDIDTPEDWQTAEIKYRLAQDA